METIKKIDVGGAFYHRLTNRDRYQNDGKHHAVEFRETYLKELDNEQAWMTQDAFIRLDFSHVKKIGPSFANEAFGYFTKYTTPKKITEKIIFEGISEVALMIIEEELEAGYKTR
jgi:hypothetical protein